MRNLTILLFATACSAQIIVTPPGGGGSGTGLPTASAAGQVPTSTGAGTTYTAQTPSFGLTVTSLNNTASHTLISTDAQVYTAVTGTTATTIVLPLVPPYPFTAIFGNCTSQNLTFDAGSNSAIYFNFGTTSSTNILVKPRPPGCVDVRVTVPNNAQSTYAITQLGTLSTWSCQPGLGDGTNAMSAATYLESTCYNDQGVTITLSAIKCFSDNSGTTTMAVTNSAGTALLSGAVTCSSAFAAGTQSATVTLAAADYLKFTFVADGSSKQVTGVITGSR